MKRFGQALFFRTDFKNRTSAFSRPALFQIGIKRADRSEQRKILNRFNIAQKNTVSLIEIFFQPDIPDILSNTGINRYLIIPPTEKKTGVFTVDMIHFQQVKRF